MISILDEFGHLPKISSETIDRAKIELSCPEISEICDYLEKSNVKFDGGIKL